LAESFAVTASAEELGLVMALLIHHHGKGVLEQLSALLAVD
jgi:hypothetical protein